MGTITGRRVVHGDDRCTVPIIRNGILQFQQELIATFYFTFIIDVRSLIPIGQIPFRIQGDDNRFIPYFNDIDGASVFGKERIFLL